MEYLGTDKPVNRIIPHVSVVVPTYQHKDYIVDCIEGILMQKTTFDFEIVIGEDESTDGTREICIEYASKFPGKIRLFLRDRRDVIYIDEKPTGRYNFIANLQAARGKYIAECEGDDYWTDPLKLQKQVDLLEQRNELSWCFHLAKIVQKDKSGEGNFRIPKENEFDTETIAVLGGGFFVTSSIMFRAEAVKKLPDFFLTVKSADFALVLLFSLFGKGVCIKEFMGVYRIHEGGIFSANKGQYKKRIHIDLDNIKLLNSFNQYSGYKFNSVIQEVILNHYGLIVRRPLATKNYSETLKLLAQYWPKMSFIVKLRTLKDIVRLSLKSYL